MIASKLFLPRLRPELVARPRLSALLQAGTGSKLTLLSAPAGFGKTTLLAQWLSKAPQARLGVAWLALDSADHDPSTFWSNVVAALQTVQPTIGAGALELSREIPLPTERLLTTLLNDLAGIAQETIVVLDDYHWVDNREIDKWMVFLLDHLPPAVHLVLGTRVDPAMPLSRWRVRGELHEIRAAELRFTPSETAAYFDAAAGLELATEQVAALEQRTEGWVAALQLAALSLKGREDTAGFIDRFTGNDRFILDYLVEEVLAQQSEPVRTFLLQTSVLDRLTGPLCDAVTGRDDGREQLTALERANLFVVPLDERREWFRYHRLFADVLRARLLDEPSAQLPLLHQRASHWYAGQDMVPDAINHALAAGDHDTAAHLMEAAVPTIRRTRQDWMLRDWLKALPADVVARSPILSVFQGFMLMVSGDLDGVEPWLTRAELALAAAPDHAAPEEAAPEEAAPRAITDELRTLPATIAVYRASMAQARGDVPGTAVHARHALELAGPGDHLARGAATGFLGLAAWAEGQVRLSLSTFTQAVASLRAAGNLVDELSGTVLLADMWFTAGRPDTARRLLAEALELAASHGPSTARAAAELHVGLSEMLRSAGDLASAREHLGAAAKLLEGAAMTESRFRWFVATGLLTAAEGDPREAIRLLDQAAPLYRQGFFPDIRPIAAVKARLLISSDRLAEATDWASEQGLSTTDNATYLREFEHLTLVRLLIAWHRAHPEADLLLDVFALLDRLRMAASTSGRASSLVEILILQALVHEELSQRVQAREALALAVAAVAEPLAYARLFLDEGEAMTGLLRDAARHGGAEYLLALLRMAGTTQGHALDASQQTTSDPPLSERELAVLRLLGSELGGPAIAAQLFISYNTLRTHTKHIFTKLGVTTRQAAVHRARERGLL
ncbi:LuxR C-terminal-related transcriptional regulator [Arthrobacter sp. LAPM80]|uniref:LuxR C-terminal-related transcriptional regulator n=1 Tax=Arthrobacter sp. LAPM80 TaxID=3141788 RepID=UPI00398AEE6E